MRPMRFGISGLLLETAAADPQDLYASFTTEPQFDGIYSYVAPGSGLRSHERASPAL